MLYFAHSSGRITIEQPKADDPTTVALEFRDLTACATAPGCAFHVHESAVVDESCESTGGHYSPDGYQSDVWDLSTKLGNLQTARVEQVGRTVSDLPVFGPDSVVGKSIVIHKPNGDRWVCATIEPGGRTPSGRPSSTQDSGASATPACNDGIGSAIDHIEADAEAQTGAGVGVLASVFAGGLLVGIIATMKICGGKKNRARDDGIEMSMYSSGEKSDITL